MSARSISFSVGVGCSVNRLNRTESGKGSQQVPGEVLPTPSARFVADVMCFLRYADGQRYSHHDGEGVTIVHVSSVGCGSTRAGHSGRQAEVLRLVSAQPGVAVRLLLRQRLGERRRPQPRPA